MTAPSQNSKAKPNFPQIPDDIIRLIISYLNLTEKCKLLCLSKTFRQQAIVDDLWIPHFKYNSRGLLDKNYYFAISQLEQYRKQAARRLVMPTKKHYNERRVGDKTIIAVFGGVSCGKSTLLTKYSTNSMELAYENLEEYYTIHLKMPDDEQVPFYFVPGGFYRAFNRIDDFIDQQYSSYVECAHGFMLTYSVTCSKSLEKCKELLERIISDRKVPPERLPIILVGCKSDLEAQREVTCEEANALAKQYECSHIETSALTGQNIKEAICAIAYYSKGFYPAIPHTWEKLNNGEIINTVTEKHYIDKKRAKSKQHVSENKIKKCMVM
ncbi:GTP-binding protein rhb1 [Acrasis kona]|uniref:small monomeric GTPase n=1 Tax=Acrasis kona TaxID=1008807 RepID=A0AAW2ZLM7_9EUKA